MEVTPKEAVAVILETEGHTAAACTLLLLLAPYCVVGVDCVVCDAGVKRSLQHKTVVEGITDVREAKAAMVAGLVLPFSFLLLSRFLLT